MAIVYDNAITRGLIGTLGNIYFRNINGKTYMSKMPVRTCPRSKKQKQSSRKFKKAANYAKATLFNPELNEVYRKAAKGVRNWYTLAICDYMQPPKIDLIAVFPSGLAQPSHIYITIKNVVKVQEVRVTVTDVDGFIIASGQAEATSRKNDWVFRKFIPEAESRGFMVTVAATDLAGNKGTGKRHFPDGNTLY